MGYRINFKPFILALLGPILLISVSNAETIAGDANLDKTCIEQMAGEIQVNCYTRFNSATFGSLNVSTITTANNQGYILLYSSTVFDVSGDSATTVANYIPTKTFITITPKRTTSRIKVTAFGGLSTDAGNTANAFATLKRDTTDLNPSTQGFCITDAAVAGTVRGNCSITLIDIPNTVSAVTYRVYIRNDSAGTTVHWGTNAGGAGLTSGITVEEWGY